jgi:hypothetical protein
MAYCWRDQYIYNLMSREPHSCLQQAARLAEIGWLGRPWWYWDIPTKCKGAIYDKYKYPIISNTDIFIFLEAESLAASSSKQLGQLGLAGRDVPIQFEGAILD